MKKLDEMLSKWPMPEKPQLEADEAAERVMATITAGQLPASIDDSLLVPPLPQGPEEGARAEGAEQVKTSAPQKVESKMSKDRTRDRTSFQELAKLATTPPPSSAVPASPTSSGQAAVVRGKEAEASDSGIVDLKMIATMDPGAAQRAQSTPLAAEGLFEDESAPPKPAVSAQTAAQATATPAPAPAAASAVPQAAAEVPAAAAPLKKSGEKKSDEKKGGGGVVIAIGALVAAAAIAAGGFFFVKWQRAHHTELATSGVSAPDKAATTAAAKNTTAPAASGSPEALAQNDTQEAPQPTVDSNGKPLAIMPKAHARHTGGGTATGGATEPAPTGTVDPKLVANVPTGAGGGSSGDLSEAMKAAAGGGTGLGQGAQQTDDSSKFAAGNVPQRPSQGQVAGAIGSVMPNARACLSAGDPVSRATITFQSDGTVKSVNVTGFAAGKPVEACIKGALSKAKVDPFAEATYPMTVSVRPE